MFQLLHPYFYKAVIFTHWVLPCLFSILFWKLHQRNLNKMEEKLEDLVQREKQDLFPVIPNYTRILWQLSHWLFLLVSILVCVVVGAVFVKGVPEKGLAVRSGFEKMSLESSRKDFEALNPEKKKIVLKRDFSGSALVMAYFGLRVFLVEGLQRKMTFSVPGDWDAEKAGNVFKTKKLIQGDREGKDWVAEESFSYVDSFTRSPFRMLVSFLCSQIMMVLPFLVALGFLQGLVCSFLGSHIEKRLIKKIHQNKHAMVQARIVGPFFKWAYKRWGKNCKQWCYLLCDAKGNQRLAIITSNALKNSDEGYFLDTWPRLPVPSERVFGILLVVTGITVVTSWAFYLYMIPLFTKNVYFPKG